jgi:hypothetical protein
MRYRSLPSPGAFLLALLSGLTLAGCACDVGGNVGGNVVPSANGKALDAGVRTGFRADGQVGPGATKCPNGDCGK